MGEDLPIKIQPIEEGMDEDGERILLKAEFDSSSTANYVCCSCTWCLCYTCFLPFPISLLVTPCCIPAFKKSAEDRELYIT
jgi:hypothetical protein